ncbi:hypothetical protein CASFOL_027693 [Castilleja foliolosa]|uniref:OTU domain-containing protein n=1 Tax=Castilleja foliolosa TaxID=1961234 RepID=A0ABD3CGE9_9LAMI
MGKKGKNSKKSSKKKLDPVVPGDIPPEAANEAANEAADDIPGPDDDLNDMLAALDLYEPSDDDLNEPSDDDLNEPSKEDHDYSLFVNNVRETWAEEVKWGNVYVLPQENQSPKHSNICIYVDRHKGIKVLTERYNGYAKAFSIFGEENQKEYRCWFDDQTTKKGCKLLHCKGTYGGMMHMAKYTELREAKVGKRALVEAYFGLKDYLIGIWEGTEISKDMRKRAGKGILSIVIMVCEGARFEDIRRTVTGNYNNKLSLEDCGRTEIRDRVRNWSSSSKGEDSDIRLFLYNDWKRIPRDSMDKLREAICASLSLKPLIRYKVRIVVGDGNSLFRALSHQLHKTEEKYNDVRAEVVKKLKNDKRRYELFFVNEKQVKESYDECVNYPWGDDISLQAAIDVHNLRLILMIWNPSEGKWNKRVKDPEGHIERDIHLRFYGKHYDSITPINSEKEEIDYD